MDKPYESPQSRLLPTLVIFLFVLGALYGLFVFFQQFSLNRELAQLEGRRDDLNIKMEELRAEQIEELFWAQELKTRVEAQSIAWSKVIRSVQDLTPVTVFVSAYSATQDGSVQLSALGDSYGSVSDLIRALSEGKDLSEVFVPSVTLGSTSDGQDVVSFSLKFHYEP